MEARKRELDVRGRNVALIEAGSGPPLVYLHGFADVHGVAGDLLQPAIDRRVRRIVGLDPVTCERLMEMGHRCPRTRASTGVRVHQQGAGPEGQAVQILLAGLGFSLLAVQPGGKR